LQLREIEALTSASQTELKRTAEVYEDALTEISHLARDDMIELKSFQTPPPLVKTVMEAVCLLMGAPPDWESARRLLADNEARNRLAGLDKDRIPEKTLKTLQKWALSFPISFVSPSHLSRFSLFLSLCFVLISSSF
jgi:dynein heavy chain